jgi:hypothetical protein
MMEAATVIRSVGEILNVRLDAPNRTLTVSGPAWQTDLAAWVLARLDRDAAGQPLPIERYEIPGMPDSSVRVFFASGPQSPEQLQELSTTIRSVIEIRRGFVFSEAKALVIRGTAGEVAAAEWLFTQLDQQPGTTLAGSVSGSHMPGTDEGVVRVFWLRHTLSPEEFLAGLARVRMEAKIRRMFPVAFLRAVAVRGTADQIRAAEQLLRERQLF